LSECSAHALKTAHALGILVRQHVTLVHAFDAIARGKLFIAGATEAQIADYVADERRRAEDELLTFLVTHEFVPKAGHIASRRELRSK
jgi:universal stress protein E